MKTYLRFGALSILLIAVFCGIGSAAGNFDVNANVLAGIQFPIPEKDAEKEYLGLLGKGAFSLSQVSAHVLIVEVFSMYCPVCQREAPVVNELYTSIDNDATLKKNVKLIGIGIGNTPFEVEVYRKKFNVLFPLFADDSLELQKISNERFRTPTFLLIKLGRDSTVRVSKIHVGAIKNIAEFFREVKELSETDRR